MRRERLTARSVAQIPGVRRSQHLPFVEPCLATLREKPPVGDEWIYEIKYDGYRAQAHLRRGEPIIYSRRGYDWSDTFGNITQSLSALPSREVILDGEVVALNEKGISDFHRLQSELARKRSDRLVYLVFDILYLNGFDLRSAKLVDRKAVLAELLKGSADGPVRLSTHLEADGAVMFDRACAMQLEGIICKDRSSLYRSGRQDSWIKVKCAKTDTFPIVAFVEKLGARPRRIASLYLGRWEGDRLLYAGKAQSGFKQAMLYELRERLDRHIRQSSPLSVPVKKPKATWVDPVLPAEIEYSSLTSERLLRAPVFKGIREELVEIPSQQTQRQANRVCPGTRAQGEHPAAASRRGRPVKGRARAILAHRRTRSAEVHCTPAAEARAAFA